MDNHMKLLQDKRRKKQYRDNLWLYWKSWMQTEFIL